MDEKYKPYFEKYEEIVRYLDSIFDKLQNEYPELVKCKIGCSDCCHALFDIGLIEAVYINHEFNKVFPEKEKQNILEIANKHDRKIYKLKHKLYKESQENPNYKEILKEVSKQRIKCAFLNDENDCIIYNYRPITCRLYGIPILFNGDSHTCGKSGFKEGSKYPTINMDTINQKLLDISISFIDKIKPKNKELGTLFIPVSMAILKSFDDEDSELVQKQ